MPVWRDGVALMALPMLGGGGGGGWTAGESPVHINVLELHAAKLTLLALAPNVSHSHIRFMLDNTTVAAYIDKMGGGGGGLHSPTCNEIALSIWHWAKDRNNWLSTAFITGIENTVADFHSQNFRDNTEWMLSPVVYKKLTAISFVPKVDLFAITKLPIYPICNLEASEVADRPPTNAEARERLATEREDGHGASPSFKAGSLSDDYIRAAIQGSGLSTMATTLICNAWREGTKQQYNSVDGESFVVHRKSIPLRL